MVAFSYAISKIIVDEYGKHEFLRRLADPLWFHLYCWRKRQQIYSYKK
jgi:hypothetical protein